MTTQINTNQQTKLEKQTTKKDITILFVGDVAIFSYVIKTFLSEDLTTVESKLFVLVLGLYGMTTPFVRDGLLRCYKSKKKKDFIKIYLHPWFPAFLIFTISLIFYACK